MSAQDSLTVSAPSPSSADKGSVDTQVSLEDASYEELVEAVRVRLAEDRAQADKALVDLEISQKRLEEKQSSLHQLEQRIFAITDGLEDVVELNVGGVPMSTTRAVLCSATGSLLAGLFSGNFDKGHKRDKNNRIFLDVDPLLFSKVLSHLRLRRLASPDRPAPLPHVPEELRPEYEMMVHFFGLEAFMYGDVGPSSNICQKLAELASVPQNKLQSNELVSIKLSSTGGVTASYHEEVLGATGFHERSLENSYGAFPNSITIRFLLHRIRVEAMEMRAKTADIAAHMSNQWTFVHGRGLQADKILMQHEFSRSRPSTARLETGFGSSFVDEIQWTFQRDFCLEHIVLYGRVVPK